MAKVKIVVMNEHTLGYILPEMPEYVQILSASILRGATFTVLDGSVIIGSLDKVRPACLKDFDTYRVYSKGFVENDRYEFNRGE